MADINMMRESQAIDSSRTKRVCPNDDEEGKRKIRKRSTDGEKRCRMKKNEENERGQHGALYR